MSKVTGTPQVEANGEGAPSVPSTETVDAANGLKTPLEHGRDAGLVRDTKVAAFNGRSSVVRSAEYRVAALLHGWDAHDRVSVEPLKITREAFDAAIKAANTPDDSGKYGSHAAALAPHKGNS